MPERPGGGRAEVRRELAMSPSVTLEQVTALAAQLSPAEQLRLVERIVHDLAASPLGGEPARRRSWSEVRGIVAYPLFGEDAQTWVSRTRRESDEQRERQWRRSP
jgi:hypothetical protein